MYNKNTSMLTVQRIDHWPTATSEALKHNILRDTKKERKHCSPNPRSRVTNRDSLLRSICATTEVSAAAPLTCRTLTLNDTETPVLWPRHLPWRWCRQCGNPGGLVWLATLALSLSLSLLCSRGWGGQAVPAHRAFAHP